MSLGSEEIIVPYTKYCQYYWNLNAKFSFNNKKRVWPFTLRVPRGPAGTPRTNFTAKRKIKKQNKKEQLHLLLLVLYKNDYPCDVLLLTSFENYHTQQLNKC